MINQLRIKGKDLLLKDLTIEMLADEFGKARAKEAIAEDIKDAIGKEVRRRRRKRIYGLRFDLNVVKTSTSTLDRTGLKDLLGDALEKFVKTSKYTKILCTAHRPKGRAA